MILTVDFQVKIDTAFISNFSDIVTQINKHNLEQSTFTKCGLRSFSWNLTL